MAQPHLTGNFLQIVARVSAIPSSSFLLSAVLKFCRDTISASNTRERQKSKITEVIINLQCRRNETAVQPIG